MTDTFFIAALDGLNKYAWRYGYLLSAVQSAADELEAIGGHQPPLVVLGVIRDLRAALVECERRS